MGVGEVGRRGGWGGCGQSERRGKVESGGGQGGVGRGVR